jgi:hypothetical protein
MDGFIPIDIWYRRDGILVSRCAKHANAEDTIKLKRVVSLVVYLSTSTDWLIIRLSSIRFRDAL